MARCDEAARGIAEIVDETMASAARVHAVENGKDTAGRTLIAFGGAAPLHAARHGAEARDTRVVVPVDAGVGSAHGFLMAPVAYEVARSHYAKLRKFEPDIISGMLAAMADEAREIVRKGAQNQALTEVRTAFARYVGQGHEIPVLLPLRPLTNDDAATLREAFEKAYMRQYGRLIDGVDIEILTWTLTVQTAAAGSAAMPAAVARSAAAPAGRREIFDVGQAGGVSFAVFRRCDLGPGSTLAGPAIIVEDATSTVVGVGYDAQIGRDGSIIMTRRRTA